MTPPPAAGLGTQLVQPAASNRTRPQRGRCVELLAAVRVQPPDRRRTGASAPPDKAPGHPITCQDCKADAPVLAPLHGPSATVSAAAWPGPPNRARCAASQAQRHGCSPTHTHALGTPTALRAPWVFVVFTLPNPEAAPSLPQTLCSATTTHSGQRACHSLRAVPRLSRLPATAPTAPVANSTPAGGAGPQPRGLDGHKTGRCRDPVGPPAPPTLAQMPAIDATLPPLPDRRATPIDSDALRLPAQASVHCLLESPSQYWLSVPRPQPGPMPRARALLYPLARAGRDQATAPQPCSLRRGAAA